MPHLARFWYTGNLPVDAWKKALPEPSVMLWALLLRAVLMCWRPVLAQCRSAAILLRAAWRKLSWAWEDLKGVAGEQCQRAARARVGGGS
eukprot:240170-Rhodomonas_salina.1